VTNWHVELISAKLAAVREGRIRRLIVSVPPTPFEVAPGLGRLSGQGCRIATSVGGVLTGRGADIIIIDDPLKPEEALSQA
jgi:hypothetical protein